MMKLVTPVTIGLVCGLAFGWWGYPRLAFEAIEQPLDFSHLTHTGDAVGMDCMDCHAGSDERFVSIPAIEQCAACHESPLTENAVELRLVDEFVTPGREIEWLVYSRQPAGVRFSHAQHIELAGLECASCHGGHAATATLPPLYRNRLSTYGRSLWGRGALGPDQGAPRGLDMNDCDACHRERGVVDSCLDCHR